MSDDNSTSLSIGGQEYSVGLSVGSQTFVFTPRQVQFLKTLQKIKNVHAAALSVDKSEEWGQKFLSSQKFKTYISAKMNEYSERGSLTVEWWYQFGKWAADGCKEFYVVACAYCSFGGTMNKYEVESCRNDEMKLDVPCPSCFKPLVLEFKNEPFKPSREQIEAWKDLGARLIPKIERIHHQFENSEIVFESTEGGQ